MHISSQEWTRAGCLARQTPLLVVRGLRLLLPLLSPSSLPLHPTCPLRQRTSLPHPAHRCRRQGGQVGVDSRQSRNRGVGEALLQSWQAMGLLLVNTNGNSSADRRPQVASGSSLAHPLQEGLRCLCSRPCQCNHQFLMAEEEERGAELLQGEAGSSASNLSNLTSMQASTLKYRYPPAGLSPLCVCVCVCVRACVCVCVCVLRVGFFDGRLTGQMALSVSRFFSKKTRRWFADCCYGFVLEGVAT